MSDSLKPRPPRKKVAAKKPVAEKAAVPAQEPQLWVAKTVIFRGVTTPCEGCRRNLRDGEFYELHNLTMDQIHHFCGAECIRTILTGLARSGVKIVLKGALYNDVVGRIQRNVRYDRGNKTQVPNLDKRPPPTEKKAIKVESKTTRFGYAAASFEPSLGPWTGGSTPTMPRDEDAIALNVASPAVQDFLNATDALRSAIQRNIISESETPSPCNYDSEILPEPESNDEPNF